MAQSSLPNAAMPYAAVLTVSQCITLGVPVQTSGEPVATGALGTCQYLSEHLQTPISHGDAYDAG